MKSFWLLAFLAVVALAWPQACGGHSLPQRGYGWGYRHDDNRHDDHHDDHKDDHHDDHHDDDHHDDHKKEDCDCKDPDKEQSLQLDKLTHQIRSIHDLIDGSASPEVFGEDIEDMEAKLDDIGGHGCEHFHDFQCGGEQPHCISNLLMCDGHDDCSSKMDEDSYHCTVLTGVGSKWRGTKVYDHCTKHRPQHMEIDITNVETTSYFPARPQITAHILIEAHTAEADEWVNLLMHGHWSPADRAVVLHAPETDGLGFTCEFHGHDHNTCVGHVMREKEWKPCAEFTFHRMD